MSEMNLPQGAGFEVRRNQPLIGIIMQNDEEEVVHYFTDEEEADKASTKNSIQRALSLAGAWKDLGDWDDVLDELDRIRHESKPTPPIEL